MDGSSRTQQVILDGATSEKAPVISGVTQGTVLGPLLFLLFINDLLDCVTPRTRLFADDCIVYQNIQTPSKYSAMIGCLRTRECKQPIIALYFESENVLKSYNLETSIVFWVFQRRNIPINSNPLEGAATVPHKDEYSKYSFFPLTIPVWNSLPASVAEAPDLALFKQGLSSLTF